MTATYTVVVGEIEHQGDVDFSLEQIRAVPCITNTEVIEVNFDTEEMHVRVTSTEGPTETLRALEEAEVCL